MFDLASTTNNLAPKDAGCWFMLCVATHPCYINIEICCSTRWCRMPETCHMDDEYSVHVENPRYKPPHCRSGITHVTPEKKAYITNHIPKPITPNGEFTELNRQRWRIINSRAHPIGFSSLPTSRSFFSCYRKEKLE